MHLPCWELVLHVLKPDNTEAGEVGLLAEVMGRKERESQCKMKLPRATEPAFPPGPQECWPPDSGRGPRCLARACGGGDLGWRRSDRNLLESVSIRVGRLLNLTLLSALPFWSGSNSLLLFLSVGQVVGWRPRKQALKGRTACRMFVKKALGVSTWAGREALSWDASRGQPAAWPTAGSSGASEL